MAAFPTAMSIGVPRPGPRVRARVVVSGMQWRHERRQAILSREAGEGDHAKHGGGGDPKRGAWAYALHGRSRSARTSPGHATHGGGGDPKRGAWACPLHRLRRSPSPVATRRGRIDVHHAAFARTSPGTGSAALALSRNSTVMKTSSASPVFSRS